jgi:hypothetical protein
MHFDVDLLSDGRIQITSHPMGDDERIHSRQPYDLNSDQKICGMSINEIASLVAFETSNDGTGEVISKTPRETGQPPYEGEIPAWLRKRS